MNDPPSNLEDRLIFIHPLGVSRLVWKRILDCLSDFSSKAICAVVDCCVADKAVLNSSDDFEVLIDERTQIMEEPTLEQILVLAADSESENRFVAAVSAMLYEGETEALDQACLALLADPEEKVRSAAVGACSERKIFKAKDLIANLLLSEPMRDPYQYTKPLYHLLDDQPSSTLVFLSNSEQAWIAYFSCLILKWREIDDNGVANKLDRLCQHEKIREFIRRATRELEGRDDYLLWCKPSSLDSRY